jgi:hypothetical protein
MATYYWVGGSGNWDASTTTNWATSSGGTGSAGVPTSADNVIFDSLSNTTLYTVTVGTNAVCADLTAAGPLTGAVTLSLGATAVLNCYGSMTLPAANLTLSSVNGALIFFLATTTGKTVTTNGVNIGTSLILTFNGSGGGWTLGSAITGTNLNIQINTGSFATGNYNITAGIFSSQTLVTKSVTLGSSTILLSSINAVVFVTTGLTFNAGTSQITCSNASPLFAGGGLTFYNVTFSSTALSVATITGANTFNNLTYTARAAAGIGITTFDGGVTNTINGTLTLASGTTGVARLWLRSNAVGSPATLSVATLAAMTDIDFRDITVAGASSPWSGTRIGNCLGNTNITFTGARTVYWVSAASANWNGAVWNTSSGTTGGATTNLPLAQDSIVIDNAGLTAGNVITLNGAYNIGNLSFSTRSNAATFATGTATSSIYGDYTLSSAITISGTAALQFTKQSGTATITSAAITFTQPVTINAPSGTVRINGNLTLGSTLTTTLTAGTLDLTNNGAGNYVLSTGNWSSVNSNTRAITFGTGNITLTNNNTTLFSMSNSTGFTYTGTPTINLTYSGSTGTRTISFGSTGGTEASAINFNISAGTDSVNFSAKPKNINFTGFSGSLSASIITMYGNLTISTGMSVASTSSILIFAATSGTQQITTNNITLDFPITQDGVGGTVQLQDNLTIGSTRTFTLTNGTLDLNSKTLSVGLFSTSNANTRSILFANATMTLTSSGTVFDNGTSTGMTITGQTTGLINCTSSSSKTFAGGGLSYPKLNQGGTGALTISGSNSFPDIGCTSLPSSILFTPATTTTVTQITCSGTNGNLLTLASVTPGSTWTISDSAGTNTITYASIKDSIATGGATFYDINGVNAGNNTGWTFLNSAFSSGNFFLLF